MSILEEYRERIIQRERADMLATIAELEAENVDFEKGAMCDRDEIESLKAERAALNARRCGGCDHADKNGDPWGCRANMLLFPKPAECCNRWKKP